jgi:hypothetical protein
MPIVYPFVASLSQNWNHAALAWARHPQNPLGGDWLPHDYNFPILLVPDESNTMNPHRSQVSQRTEIVASAAAYPRFTAMQRQADNCDGKMERVRRRLVP